MGAIYLGSKLIASLGGGVNLSTTTSTRYLIGHSSSTGTGVEDLSTNTNCYMSSGKLYSNRSAVITESDTSKLVGAYSAATKGYVTLGRIKINWGTLSIGANSRGSTTFASSFRGDPYSAVCTWDYDHTGGQENYSIYELSYSTIYIVNGEGTTRLFRWIAIGPA